MPLPLRTEVLNRSLDEDARRRAAITARTVLAPADRGLRVDHLVVRRVDRGPDRASTGGVRRRVRAMASIVPGRRHRPVRTEQARRRSHPLPGEQTRARSRRREAETQTNLLLNRSTDSKSVMSDFNPYRYLASEGFLPGYSFPRLAAGRVHPALRQPP
ncbi:hypothetical protein LV779_14640 [Streptomyces thinghirensis]|nr:hypothetical protein [Streptomyces thinghirensis]